MFSFRSFCPERRDRLTFFALNEVIPSSLLVWRRSRQIDIIPLWVAKLVSTPFPLPSVLDEVLPLTLSFATLPELLSYLATRSIDPPSFFHFFLIIYVRSLSLSLREREFFFILRIKKSKVFQKKTLLH